MFLGEKSESWWNLVDIYTSVLIFHLFFSSFALYSVSNPVTVTEFYLSKANNFRFWRVNRVWLNVHIEWVACIYATNTGAASFSFSYAKRNETGFLRLPVRFSTRQFVDSIGILCDLDCAKLWRKISRSVTKIPFLYCDNEIFRRKRETINKGISRSYSYI